MSFLTLTIVLGCSNTGEETKSVAQNDEMSSESKTLMHPLNISFEFSIEKETYKIFAHTKEDLDAAIHEVEAASQSFMKLLKMVPPQISVFLFRSNEELQASGAVPLAQRGAHFFLFLSKEALKEMGEQADKPGIISHEVAHHYLINAVPLIMQAVGKPERPLKLSNYGSGYLPDWIDEAVALGCQLEEFKIFHKNLIHQFKGNLIPLNELFEMPHPVPKEKIRDSEKQHGEWSAAIIKIDKEHQEATERFYSQCMWLVEYLHEKGGDGVLLFIVSGTLKGRTMDELLAENTPLPKTVKDLENDWLKWLEKK